MNQLSLTLSGRFGVEERLILGSDTSGIKLVTLTPDGKLEKLASTKRLTNYLIPLLIQEEGLILVPVTKNSVKFWYFLSGKKPESVEVTGDIKNLFYNSNTKEVLIFSIDRKNPVDYKSYLSVYDLQGEEKKKRITLKGTPQAASFVNNSLIVSTVDAVKRGMDRSIKILDANTLKSKKKITTGGSEPYTILSRDLGDQGFEILVSSRSDNILIRISSNDRITTIPLPEFIGGRIPWFQVGYFYAFSNDYHKINITSLYNPSVNNFYPLYRSANFLSEGFTSDKLLLVNQKELYLPTSHYIGAITILEPFLTNRENLLFAFTLPFTRNDYHILYCVLKLKLKKYLPNDLIKFSFDMLGLESSIQVNKVKGGFML